jgi:transposase-like protein
MQDSKISNYSKISKDFAELLDLVSNLKIHKCIYCNSLNIIKHGKYKNTHRYKCKDCKKTFIPTTGTTIYYLNKLHVFLEYYRIIMNEGPLTIHEFAKRLKISPQTAFDWRHKIFVSYSESEEKINKEVMLKSFYFNFSQKGRRLNAKLSGIPRQFMRTGSVIIENNSDFYINLLHMGELKNQHVNRNLKKFCYSNIKIYGSEEVIALLESKNFTIANVQSLRNKKILEVNNEIIFRNTIRYTYKGVSTKYFQSYSNFFSRFYSRCLKYSNEFLIRTHEIWFKFIQLERLFRSFIIDISELKLEFKSIRRKWKYELRYKYFDYENLYLAS